MRALLLIFSVQPPESLSVTLEENLRTVHNMCHVFKEQRQQRLREEQQRVEEEERRKREERKEEEKETDKKEELCGNEATKDENGKIK